MFLNTDIDRFIDNELKELESRDVDTLFECIRDNLIELGIEFTDAMDDELHVMIERKLRNGERK